MKYPLLLLCYLISFSLYSQSISPSVVATSGSSYQAGSMRVDWTIGEVAITTLSGSSVKLTQGFHQPNYIITDVPQIQNNIADIKVYPNPTLDLIHINYDSKEPMTISLIDISGKILLNKNLTSNKNNESISLSNFPNGLYFLFIKNDKDNRFKTLKIQKTN